ncbi:MAG: polysaccharide biosynthesis tyrosine autokinase [Myxococcota bacterium]
MSDKIDFYRYLLSLKKRWPLVLTIFVTVMLLGVVYTLRSERLYKSSATLIIMPQAPQVLTGVQEVNPVGTANNFWAEEALLQTEYQIMSGRQILKRAFDRMNLAKTVGKNIDAADYLGSYVSIVPAKKTRIVSVEVVHQDPKFATTLANTIASAYLDYKIERRREGSGEAINWLQIQQEDLKKKLEISENKLYAYMESHGILNASLESQMEMLKTRVGLFEGKLAEIESQKIAGRVDANALSRVAKEPALLDSLADVQKAPMVGEIKAKLLELKRQNTELSERYLPEHPKIKTLQTEITALEQTLREEIGNTLTMLEREQRTLLSTEQGLREAIATQRQQEASLNKIGLDYGRLKREVDTNTKLYDLVANRLKEIGLTGMLQANNVSLLDQARIPSAPYKPDWNTNMIASLMLALLLSVGMALLLEIMDQTFKTQEDVESYLKLPFLGVLPAIHLENKAWRKDKTKQELFVESKDRDLYIATHPKSMVAECSRAIRTNLLFMTPDKPFKSLLVSSSMAGEGKTTTAINLAIAMAQSGSKVILVDGDLRRPRVHKSFDLNNDVGLSTVIVDECDLDRSIHHSSIPGLDVLTCGPVPPNPSELLHTQKFKQVFAELETRYDKIIFDSAPVGAVTDPVILGALVDGALLVIKTGVTHREATRRAVRALQDAHANLFGVILNDFDAHKTQYGYSYGRYYWYGRYYYGQYGDKKPYGESAA